jgi:uncharacterized protein
MDDILRAFAEAGQRFPREAMEMALARWDDVSPRLLEALADYAEGRDRTDAAASAALHVLYLAAQQRDRRAFPLLCRLAQAPDALDTAIGDGVTEDFAGILAATFDGDLDRLRALILDGAADPMVRNAAIEALTLLFADGTLPMRQAEPCLWDLHARLIWQKAVEGWVWVGWQQAVAVLGLAALRPLALALFRTGRIDRSIMDARDFEADLQDGLAPGVDRLALLEEQGVAPIGDVVPLFASWHEMREAEAARAAARAASRPAEAPIGGPAGMPRVDPFRHVGRNDPCPCGSEKKFKKCCLPA